MDYLKKDLTKVMVMAGVVVLLLVGLAVWNVQTGALDRFAERIF